MKAVLKWNDGFEKDTVVQEHGPDIEFIMHHGGSMMKSSVRFFPLLVLAFLFFVSCDFWDTPKESDLPIEEWEVTVVEFRTYTSPPSFVADLSGYDGKLSHYDFYKDFDRTKHIDIQSFMTIPGVTFTPDACLWSYGLRFGFESGPEITESTVATFNNEWFYKVDNDGDLFTPREVVAKVRIVTKTMGITIVK